MTRRTPALIIPEHSSKEHRWKNLLWERSGYTPNEAYDLVSEYRQHVDKFAKTFGVPTPVKFVQVRITTQKPSIIYTRTKQWWDHPGLMDHIFWVFAKPVNDRLDNDFYTYYALEPKECARVIHILQKTGGLVGNKNGAFLVPCECVTLAWNERTNGVSDHLHWRPEAVKTQKQIDKEAAQDAETDRILANAYDIIDDERWAGATNYLRKELKKRRGTSRC